MMQSIIDLRKKVKDGTNWYAYCGNAPMGNVDWLGEYYIKMGYDKNRKGSGWYYYSIKQGKVTATLIAASEELPIYKVISKYY